MSDFDAQTDLDDGYLAASNIPMARPKSPPFDPSGVTMMFEILCSMAEDVAKRRGA